MATIINNPSTESSGSGVGTVVAIIILVLAIMLFFLYGLPAIRGANKGNNSTTIQVPDKVEVDLSK